MTVGDLVTRISGRTFITIVVNNEVVLSRDFVGGRDVKDDTRLKPYLDKEVDYIYVCCSGGELLLILKEV